MHKEGICYLDKRGAIAVFVDVGSSSSRWFRRREGRSRVFCFPTKEMNREERLSKSSFAGLPNVKGAVAEDARITDSPLRSELASVSQRKMALSGQSRFLGRKGLAIGGDDAHRVGGTVAAKGKSSS